MHSSLNSFLMPIVKDVPVFTSEDYTLLYPVFETKSPLLFSIDIAEPLIEFKTTVSPLLDVDVCEIIDLACFYYGDADPSYSVVDEIFGRYGVDRVLKSLTMANYDTVTAQQLLEAQLSLLKDASLELVQSIHTVFDNVDVTAIENYGSCYRLEAIHGDSVVLFKRVSPAAVELALEQQGVKNG